MIRVNTKIPLISLELFTGAGGLALGLHEAGFSHSALVEYNGDACDTLRLNVNDKTIVDIDTWRVVQTDVRHLSFRDLGPVDLIAGGPPCQPFSVGGKHRGPDDTRNMFPQFIRAICELSPRAFMMENVRGLLRTRFRKYFSYILKRLENPDVMVADGESWEDHLKRLVRIDSASVANGLRYDVSFKLLNAADFGVPQTRERVFIVGFRTDLRVDWRFPGPTHSRELLEHSKSVTGDYWRRHGIETDAPGDGIRPRGIGFLTEDMFHREPWMTVRDALKGLPEPRVDVDTPGLSNHRLIPGARQYAGHTGSPLDMPAKTLKAGDHGVPGGENMVVLPDGSVRYFTVREAARIQTFPDTWKFSGVWSEAMRQLGNAVPVRLARVVAGEVARRLEECHG